VEQCLHFQGWIVIFFDREDAGSKFIWRPWHSSWRLVTGFLPRWPGFDPGSGRVGLVLDRVSLGKVSSEYFGFPCQFSFHQLLHTHLWSRAGTIGQEIK
jgi:hypothetical protein